MFSIKNTWKEMVKRVGILQFSWLSCKLSLARCHCSSTCVKPRNNICCLTRFKDLVLTNAKNFSWCENVYSIIFINKLHIFLVVTTTVTLSSSICSLLSNIWIVRVVGFCKCVQSLLILLSRSTIVEIKIIYGGVEFLLALGVVIQPVMY